jgi:outer membrane immunogenic protein
MNSKLIALLSGALSLGLMNAASAADMAVKAPPVVAPIPVFTWTGCFIGGHVGGVWATKDWNTAPGDPGIGVNGIVVGTPFGSHDVSGGIGGLQGGCDYQFAGSNWVIGFQGDYGWSNATGGAADQNNNRFFQTTGWQDESRVNALASITGRVGYSWNRFLGYVKGGYAWERDDYSIFRPTTNSLAASASETRGGWTVGIGGEYAFNNWISGFAEYDYYDFGTRRNNLLTATNTVFNVADISERKSVFKLGLNFRWAPGAAVVAKY